MKPRLRFAVILMTVLVALSPLSTAHPAAAAAPTSVRYFAETGHNIATRIKNFYEANGDVRIFGLPLTDVITENGMQVQYFERARFELHPELPDAFFVSLTQVGRGLVGGRTAGAFAPTYAKSNANTMYFTETKHALQDTFLQFWSSYGGLPVFGFPLSEPFQEVNYSDGNSYQVQYFERARMELHPAAPAGYRVQLGLLGRQLLDNSAVPASSLRAVPHITLLGTATTGYYGSFAERINNIARGAGRMNGKVVPSGGIFSFGGNLGSATANDGFVDGYAIVGGRLEKVTGGGLCQVSTTMYRAVFYAGLGIVDRTPHTYMINFYENIKGFDATVFTPQVDFKWRNDTAGPVYVAASTNPNQATVTFSLYGWSDGRTSQMVGPVESSVVQPGLPNWQFDSSLPGGGTRQIVHGRPGSDIAMQRIVTTANGSILHHDNLPSHYSPWADFFLYGPGVTVPYGVNRVPGDANPNIAPAIGKTHP